MVQHLTNKLLTYTITGPGIQPGTDSVSTLEKIVSSVIGLLTIFGVLYFTIRIIISGYSLISAVGDPKELATATKRLTNSIMGLAIIILAYGLGAFVTNLLGIQNVFDLTTAFKPIK